MKRQMISVTVFQNARAQAEKSPEVALKMIGKQPAGNIMISYRLVTPENYTLFRAGIRKAAVTTLQDQVKTGAQFLQ